MPASEFRDEARRLYDLARDAPGGRDAIVDMAPVRDQVARIRAALPPSAAGGPSAEFAPQGLKRLLGGVDDIADRMTLDQARQMRTLVTDAIDDKNVLPGVPERYLAQLRQSLTRAIDGSVDRVADPQLRQAPLCSQHATTARTSIVSRARASPRSTASRRLPATSRTTIWSRACFPAAASLA